MTPNPHPTPSAGEMTPHSTVNRDDQPCQAYKPDDECDLGYAHSCPHCDKRRWFCGNCHHDHHEGGWWGCYDNRAMKAERDLTEARAALAGLRRVVEQLPARLRIAETAIALVEAKNSGEYYTGWMSDLQEQVAEEQALAQRAIFQMIVEQSEQGEAK